MKTTTIGFTAVQAVAGGRGAAATAVWNAEGRLSGVTTPDGQRWAYRYDPLGRRSTKLRRTGPVTVEQLDVALAALEDVVPPERDRIKRLDGFVLNDVVEKIPEPVIRRGDRAERSA